MREATLKLAPVTINDAEIKQTKPWFWKTCHKCRDRLKKELMWRVRIYYDVYGRLDIPGEWYRNRCHQLHEINVCGKCCPVERDVKNYIANNNLLRDYSIYKK